MAKRRKGKPSKRKTKVNTRITAKQRQRLKDEAAKTRARIRAFSKRPDAENYIIPDAEQYALTNLIKRIQSGEKSASVLKELKSITANSMKKTQGSITTLSGYSLTPQQASRLRKAVSRANANISKAYTRYPEFSDVLPNKFDFKTIVDTIISDKSFENKLDDLSVFTPKNLRITAVNEYGEAGTEAERLYLKRVIDRENERRLEVREMSDPRKNEGYFIQQEDYDTRHIEQDKISLDRMRRIDAVWNDYARVYRSNLFIDNYLKTINMLEAILVSQGIWNSTIESRVDFIRETAVKLYNNEDLITFLSRKVPMLQISVISPRSGISMDVDFDEIYKAWADFENEYM